MTALIQERNTLRLDGSGAALPDYLRPGVAASETIWQGGMVAINAAGTAQRPQTAGSLACIGRAEIDVNNSLGAANALTVQVGHGAFKWAQGSGADTITAANLFQKCYAIDDQTVGLTNGYSFGSARPLAGIIIQVDADNGVWVLMGPELLLDLSQVNAPLVVHQARVVIATALPAYTAAGGVLTANVVGALGAFDGITPAVGDSVLVVTGGSAAAKDNGLYVVTSIGSGGTKWTFQRPLDWLTGSAIQNGSTVEVREGTAWANSTWKATATGANVVDTNDPIFFPRTQTITTGAAVAGVTPSNNTAWVLSAASAIIPVFATPGGAQGFPRISTQTAGAPGTSAIVVTSSSNTDTSTFKATVINF